MDPTTQLCSNVMIWTSIVSEVACTTIWLPFYVLSGLTKRSYMEIVLIKSICEFINAVGSSPGIPPSGSAACWFEGIVTNIFSQSSMLWTVVICEMMLVIVVKGKEFRIRIYHHVLCWGLPVVVTLLPLINTTYGSEDAWCWVVETSATPPWGMVFWKWFSFYGIVWGSIAVTFILFAVIQLHIQRNVMASTKSVVSRVFSKLRFYPWILIAAWLVPCINDLYQGEKTVALVVLANFLPCLQGFMTTVVFWTSNEDVRSQVVKRIKQLSSNEKHSQSIIFTSSFQHVRAESERSGAKSDAVPENPEIYDEGGNPEDVMIYDEGGGDVELTVKDTVKLREDTSVLDAKCEVPVTMKPDVPNAWLDSSTSSSVDKVFIIDNESSAV